MRALDAEEMQTLMDEDYLPTLAKADREEAKDYIEAFICWLAARDEYEEGVVQGVDRKPDHT